MWYLNNLTIKFYSDSWASELRISMPSSREMKIFERKTGESSSCGLSEGNRWDFIHEVIFGSVLLTTFVHRLTATKRRTYLACSSAFTVSLVWISMTTNPKPATEQVLDWSRDQTITACQTPCDDFYIFLTALRGEKQQNRRISESLKFAVSI